MTKTTIITGKSQLARLASAHKPSPRKQTPRKEDYAEIIYELIREKGYAKPVDIANHLHVTAPTVTIMMNKLREEQWIIHEKYGGIVLTEKGKEMAEKIGQRHAVLVSFLKVFGVKEAIAHKDTEGLEHYIDPGTLELLGNFVEYVRSNPDWWSRFQKTRQNNQ
jgi:Mn-dependent DtxR family transcriptional regulator